MIIVRSPLRVSLGGGGTDLPSYYEKYDGFLVAAAINKYVYITVHDTFMEDLIIKYSQMERVDTVDDIRHPIIRETMKMLSLPAKFLELSSMADIPAGTGLGSSGSFTTALIKALMTHDKKFVDARKLAEAACDIEINRLGEPIGKQDQYIAAYGGITCFDFKKGGHVEVAPLKIKSETLYNLEESLMLFFTGYSRSASSILREQDDKSKICDNAMVDNLHFVKELGIRSRIALENGDIWGFGEIMNVHWEHKKKRSQSMSNTHIDEWYKLAIENGASGGKIIGAGGGGFLMFLAKDKLKLRHAMLKIGLKEVRFSFDFEGTKVVAQS